MVPIIYGIAEKDKENLRIAENEGRLIIGSLKDIKEGVQLPMFGCKTCKIGLPRYGTIL